MNEPQIDESKKTHKLSPELRERIKKDLKEQNKRKEAWRKYSDPQLAKKWGVTTSLLEYMKRNMA